MQPGHHPFKHDAECSMMQELSAAMKTKLYSDSMGCHSLYGSI